MRENKYLLLVDDLFLKDFEVDGLNMYLTDKNGTRRTLVLKPVHKPVLVTVDGGTAYLEPGYIDAMLEYEQKKTIQEFCEKANEPLDGVEKALLTPDEVRRSFGLPKLRYDGDRHIITGEYPDPNTI